MKNNTNYRTGTFCHKTRTYFGGLFILCIAMMVSLLMIPNNVWADGSKDLYPASMNKDDYRAVLMSGDFVGEEDNFPFITQGEMFVYAKAGETIYLASSAMGSYGGKIIITDPYGNITTFNSDKSSNKGLIKDRTAELAGPKISGQNINNAYDACTFTVVNSGIYKVNFYAKNTNASNEKQTYTVGNFTQSTEFCTIAAWDITVADGQNVKSGRVYFNVFNGYITQSSSKGWNSTVYVLTNIGYVYQVDANGQNGKNFCFYSNNKGIQNEGTLISTTAQWGISNPLKDGYKYKGAFGGIKTYKNEEATKGAIIKDPRYGDYIAEKIDADNNVIGKYYEDVTHKIFYNKPDEDMPEFADIFWRNYKTGKDEKQNIWLKAKVSSTIPKISDLKLIGRESGVEGQIGPDGAYIYFNSTCEGEIEIDLCFVDPDYLTDKSKYKHLIIVQSCIKGENFVSWDGTIDNNGGESMLARKLILEAQVKVAEVHFPFTDIEYNNNGVKIRLINYQGNLVDDTKVHYEGCDENNLKNVGKSWTERSVGNDKIMDNWTFVSGYGDNPDPKEYELQYKNVDLEVLKMFVKEDVGKKRVGDLIDIYLEVVNNKVNLDASGAIVSEDDRFFVPDDAKHAAVSIDGRWKNGDEFIKGLQVVSVAIDNNYTDSNKDDEPCAFISNPNNDLLNKGIFNLKLGKKQQYKITCRVLKETAHLDIDPIGYVLRPGDVYDYQATSNFQGVPDDPYIESKWGNFDDYEYGKTESNNIYKNFQQCVEDKETPNVYIWNSAPVAVNQIVYGRKATDIYGNLLTNMSNANNEIPYDVDGDKIKLVGIEINGVCYDLDSKSNKGQGIEIFDEQEKKIVGYLKFNSDGSYTLKLDDDALDFIGKCQPMQYIIEDYMIDTDPKMVLFKENKDSFYKSKGKFDIEIQDNTSPYITERTYYVEKGGYFNLEWNDTQNDKLVHSYIDSDLFTLQDGEISVYEVNAIAGTTYNDINVTLCDGFPTNDNDNGCTTAAITIIVKDQNFDVNPIIPNGVNNQYVQKVDPIIIDKIETKIVEIADINNLISATESNDDGVIYTLAVDDSGYSIDANSGKIKADFSNITKLKPTLIVTAYSTANAENKKSVVVPVEITPTAFFVEQEVLALVGTNYNCAVSYYPSIFSGDIDFKWSGVSSSPNTFFVNVTSDVETQKEIECDIDFIEGCLDVTYLADAIKYDFNNTTSKTTPISAGICKINFVIPVATAKDIDYGNVVNIIENDKGIPGTFVYTDANGNELDKTKKYDAGEYTYNVKFVPDDVTISPIDLDPIKFKVNKIPVVYECELNSPINYGTTAKNSFSKLSVNNGTYTIKIGGVEINENSIVPYNTTGASVEVIFTPTDTKNYKPVTVNNLTLKTNPICSLKDNNPEYGVTFAEIFDLKLTDGTWEFIIGDNTYSKTDKIPYSESQQNISVKFTPKDAPAGEYAIQPNNLITTQKHKLYVCITEGVDKTYDGNDVAPAGRYTVRYPSHVSDDVLIFSDVIAKYSDSKIENEKVISLVQCLISGTDAYKYDVVLNYNSETKKEFYSKGSIKPPTIDLKISSSQEVIYGTDDATIGKGVKAQLNVTYNEEFGLLKYLEGTEVLSDGYLLPVGEHNIVAKYYPSYDLTNSASSSETKLVKVIKPTMTFNPPTNVTYGTDDATIGKGIKATVNTPAGVIKYYENDVEIPNLTALSAGDHTITAKYFGKEGDSTPMLTETKSLKVNPLEIDVKLSDILTASDKNPSKTYDGTTAVPESFYNKTIQINGIDINVSAVYVDKNATGDDEVDNKVKYTLSLADATNYSLKQSVIYGKGAISPKGIDIIMTIADKEYDGTTTATYVDTPYLDPSAIISGDNVDVQVTNLNFNTSGVGDDKFVTFVSTLIGTDKDNYIVNKNDYKAKITQSHLYEEYVTIDYLVSENIIDPNKVYDGDDFVYDATFDDDAYFSFKDANGNEHYFQLLGNYDDKNVGDNKDVSYSIFPISYDGTKYYDDKNYYADFDIKTKGSITPKHLTLTGVSVETTKEYDGETDVTTKQDHNPTLSGVVDGDDVKIKANSEKIAYNSKDVATANKITATYELEGIDATNYVIDPYTVDGNITKKDVNVSFVVSDRIYKGSSDKEATISSASIEKLGNDEVTVKVSGKGTFAEAKVGDGITVTADKSIFSLEGKDSGNYNIAGVNSSKGNIKPETLSANLSDITNSSPSKPYDGTTNIPSDFSYETTITAKTPTGIEVECTVTAEYISKNVEDGTGTESVVYHITPNDNQYAPFDIKGNGKITPKTVTVSGGTVTKSKVYDGNKTASTSIIGASVSDLISSDNGKVSVESITAEYNDEDVKDANSIKVHYVLSGDEAKNYKVDDETITDNVEITPKEIEVENTVVEERVYNGTNEAPITNNGNIKEGSVITGDVVTIASASANYGDANVGNNKDITINYTLGGADKDNYTVKNNSLKGNIKPNGDHKITLSDIVSSDPNKVYDGTTTVDSDDYNHTITVDGENGETITYTITAEYEKSDAGDDIKIVYTVTPNSSNYETFKLEGKGKITPKEIIVDGTIVKGNKTYDGKTDIEIETLGTLKDVNGNNIEFTAEADFLTSDVNPGNDGKQDVKIVYTITNSDVAKNYTVKDGTAKSTINPKEVTVDFTIADKYYDGTTTVAINGASIASGVIDADKNKVSVSPITNAVANFNDPNKGDGKTVTANKDQFTLSGDKKENYVIGTINSLLGGKINGSEIKGITLADITDGVYGEVRYNGPTTNKDNINVEYTYVLNGVDGNGNSVTDKPYTLGDIIPAGTWTITAKVNDSNYGGSGTSNTFTVNKKELYITELTIADKIYDATQNATISNSNNIQFTGKVGSDNVSVDVTSATALFDNSNAGENKNVSVTGISLTGSDAANYTVSNTYNAKGNINPKSINIVAEDMSNSTYGDKYQGEITPSDFIPNHKPTDYTYTLVDKDGNETPFNPTSDYIPAGEDWKIKVTVNDPNYSGSDETNSFNVDKKQLTVSDIVVNDKSYDGTKTATIADVFTVNGKVGNDVVNVSVNTANFSDPNIANNKNVDITFLLDDNSAKNYTILAANGKGNILPANVTINVDGLVDGIYGDVVINKDDITNPEGYDGDYTITIKDPSTGETQTLKPGDVIPAGNWEITVSVDDPNYTGSQTFGPITVDKKQLTVSDIVVNDKLYDGSITATIEDGFTVNGKVGADVVNVTVKTAEFVDENAADNKDVKVTFTLDENSAKNYEVLDASPKGNILPINVTVKVDDIIDGTYGDVVITKDDISNPEGYDGDYIITIKDTETGETQTLKPGDYIPAGNWEITVTVDDPNYTGSTTLDDPVNVDKKQLTVTDLVVNPKNYDGTKDATIADGFTVNGKVGDDVVVPTVKKAQFVDAEIGEDKDVDIEFTLSGEDAKNYEIVSAKGKGSILGKLSVVDDKVIPTKEGYTQEYERYCPGDKVELIAELEGYATECYIDFDSKAVEAGITSTGWISVESPSFEIPQDAKAGSYSGTIKYRNENIESDVYNFTFKVNIGSEYVTSRFHDVVLVDNHEGRFASYQWYYGEDEVNLNIVDNETKQFYQDKRGQNRGLDGWYSAEVTTVDGEVLMTCPNYYAEIEVMDAIELCVNPNPIMNMQEFTVTLKCVTNEMLQTASMTITTSAGVNVKTINKVERNNFFRLKSGEYVVTAVIDGKMYSAKFIVK